jgi:hypothetical protein
MSAGGGSGRFGEVTASRRGTRCNGSGRSQTGRSGGERGGGQRIKELVS